MRKISTLLCLLFIGVFQFAVAQIQLPNGGMENWDNLTQETEEPVDFNSFMTAENGGVSGFIFGFAQTQKIEISSDTRPGSTGSSSARIWSNSIFGNIANGNLTTGRIIVGSSTPTDPANHNKTKTAEPDFSSTFTAMPDSMVVWVKFNAAGSTEEARISATIHDAYDYRDPSDTDGAAPGHVVGKAVLNYGPTNGWERVSIPFDYASHPSTDAHYILLFFTTNKTPGGGDENDEVFIDDIEFIYGPSVTVAPSTTQNLVENEAGSVLTATESPAGSSREWKFSTTSGSGYASFATAQSAMTYTPQFATAGTYYVVCESTIGGSLITSNEVQINVASFTNSIAPTAAQNIEQNQAGTQLDVTENPTADSREWKFSTTSGSGYTSFASAETGASYVPLFTNVGTYYVICESTLSGIVATSNEVEIVVTISTTPSVSITPASTQNILTNTDGNVLTANETETPSSREWFFSTTSGSGYTSFATAETSPVYTPNFAATGTYYIVCKSTMSGVEYTSNEVIINADDYTVMITPAGAQSLMENIPGDTLFAIEAPIAISREWKFAMNAGGPYLSFATPQTEMFYVPLFDANDTYFVVCESDFGGDVRTSNEVGFIVNNGPTISISPTATQTIGLEEEGIMLSANTGGFTADTLEWKYSAVAGGIYAPFSTSESGMDYTPFFFNTGEYYIVCEGEFFGQMIRSNEVLVIVEEDVAIIEYNRPDFKVYATNQNLVVDLTNKDFSTATVHVFDMNGKEVTTQSLENFSTNTVEINQTTGVYIYNIVTENKIYQGKVFLR